MNRRLLLAFLGGALCSPSIRSTPASASVHRFAGASVQALMQTVIDPAADGVWNAVETTLTRAGETVRQPHTAAEWRAVRRAALTLADGATALLDKERRVGTREFPAEAAGALNSRQIQARIAARRPEFEAFAEALRAAARDSFVAVDARDASALVRAGGRIDQVCEGCHLAFWYPNQVIPPLPPESRRRGAGG